MKNFNDLLALAEKIAEDDTILHSQIPNIDFYVDQVTTFLESSLVNYRRSDDDKIMTKTMINNYTKDKVLPPPNQKKYSKNHIILLIMIYHFKQSLSIGDIMKLLNTDMSKTDDIYEAFAMIQKTEKNSLAESLQKKFDEIETQLAGIPQDDGIETLLLIISLIIDANLKKQLACKILDSLKMTKS